TSVRQDAGLKAIAEFVARFSCHAHQVVECSSLATQGDRAARVERAIVIAVDVDLGGDAGAGFGFQQDDVYDLVAAAHVQISGGATNNLNVLHLVGRNTAELAVALVLLARNTAAIDQDLVATGT